MKWKYFTLILVTAYFTNLLLFHSVDARRRSRGKKFTYIISVACFLEQNILRFKLENASTIFLQAYVEDQWMQELAKTQFQNFITIDISESVCLSIILDAMEITIDFQAKKNA